MNDKLNILALASWYPTENDPQLGVFIKKQLEAIGEKHSVTLLTLSPEDNDQSVQESNTNGLKHIAHYYKPFKTGLKKLQWYRKWVNILNNYQEEQFDLIHVHVVFPIGLIALKAQSIFNAPLLVSEHWSGYHSNLEYRGYFRKRITQKLLRKSKGVVVQSQFLKTAMEKQQLNAKYFVVPNIVEFNSTDTFQSQEDTFTFMNIADHIDSDKNISGLLRAFSLALKERKHLKLIQIGGGKDTEALKILSKKLKIDAHVEWLGRLPNELVLKKIALCNAGIINSHQETFCISAFEFLASKKQIIITACGGPEEYLPNGFGIKIPVNSDTKLCEAMLSMVNETNDNSIDKVANIVRSQFSKKEFQIGIQQVYSKIL